MKMKYTTTKFVIEIMKEINEVDKVYYKVVYKV